MFTALDRYKNNGHFFFAPTDSLEDVCTAPDNKNGVYIVYELKDGHVDMVYIGASGTRDILVVKDSLFGLKQTIINGIGPQNEPRTQAWPVKMLAEGIDALDIYWWVTYSGTLKHHPASVQSMLLFQYAEIYDSVPRWNDKIKHHKRYTRKG